jgi:hypothetical protein
MNRPIFAAKPAKFSNLAVFLRNGAACNILKNRYIRKDQAKL